MRATASAVIVARHLHVRGIVQGVGFRPYVFRLARDHGLAGWICNGGDGVQIHIEGSTDSIDGFLLALPLHSPPAAAISAVESGDADVLALTTFTIRSSTPTTAPTTQISPDLPVCDDCLRELFDPADRRSQYAYITCTNCGPRFSIVTGLPYDRPQTTMAAWPLCARCSAEYDDPADRRFHAQPVACPECGPAFRLVQPRAVAGLTLSGNPIRDAAALLAGGNIIALKGIGGYHLGCDARNASAVQALRTRKVREEKPFAVMVRDVTVARELAVLTKEAERALASPARPIVLCPAAVVLAGVAPGNHEVGLMLPYTPLHHLLFANGAPDAMVLTSGNRSDEPIAFHDDDAERRLAGIADAFVVGERPIARRMDDSVVRITAAGTTMVRRSRGYAPGIVAPIPSRQPILALGADLKNTVTLVVDGHACVSQHIGDLEHFDARTAFRDTIEDLLTMYRIDRQRLLLAHDRHPGYCSTLTARELTSAITVSVQHHRAHVASVLAERGELDRPVIGVAYDGTGYGDDGTIWGGELFVGSVRRGFERAGHLRPALLPGGDAAARSPVQAAAGFLAQIDARVDFMQPPFGFPARFRDSQALVAAGIRTIATTSAGRLFDTVAALLGFTRSMTFEGQAAIWLEQLAGTGDAEDQYPSFIDGPTIDWRPLLCAIITARREGVDPARIARGFHWSMASGIVTAAEALSREYGITDLVLSGGVFQNARLTSLVTSAAAAVALRVLTNSAVPSNDGGISLGQAAIAAAAA